MLRTCFVISPIGKEGSDVRKDADEFLEILVEPALERFDFNVVRADRIPRPTVITADIIKLVQESDVCIIDITNSNPNVFYECGRRHETGKPFVQMMKAGKTGDIPFDVAGIRTIEYDLSTPRKARQSVKILQEFIEQIAANEFSEKAAGHTMASIGEALERLERKINRLSSSPTAFVPPQRSKSPQDSIELLTSHPVDAFFQNIQAGSLQGAFSTLERVKVAAGVGQYIAGLRVLAAAGLQEAYETLIEERKKLLDRPADHSELLRSIAHAMKDYHANLGRHEEGVRELESFYKKIAAHPDSSDDLKAAVANCIGMAAWHAQKHDIGAKYETIAVSLDPSEPSYRYNQCLTFEKTEQTDALDKSLQILSTLTGLDEDHRDLLNRHGYTYAPATEQQTPPSSDAEQTKPAARKRSTGKRGRS